MTAMLRVRAAATASDAKPRDGVEGDAAWATRERANAKTTREKRERDMETCGDVRRDGRRTS